MVLGGLFLIIPLLLVLILSKKALAMLAPLGERISTALGVESLLGEMAVKVICVLILLLLCYVAGLLLQFGLVQHWSSKAEEHLFRFVPGLQILKYRMLDEESLKQQTGWRAILLKDDEHYTLAFLTGKEDDPYLSIFIPEVPRMDSGEIRYIKKEECKYYVISMKAGMDSVISFGRNGRAWEALVKENYPAKEPDTKDA